MEKNKDVNAGGVNYTLKFWIWLIMALMLGAGFSFRHQIVGAFSGSEESRMEQATLMEGKAAKQRVVKYWRAPMNPAEIYDRPGKSKMGMDLVPVYEDNEEGGLIKINPAVVQNIGVKTAVAQRTDIASSFRTIGVVTYDETTMSKIQSKVQGWVEKLYVNSTGEAISKDTILLELFSPDLVATQEEFLLALAYRDTLRKGSHKGLAKSGDELLAAARRRLMLFDVPAHQIAELEKNKQVKKTLHIHSSAEGVVIKKNVIEGMQVMPGQTLYEVADLSNVWVNVNVYEAEIPLVAVGQEALLTLTAAPGKVFRGKITYVYPFIDQKSRTVTVRLEFKNPDQTLKPDMYGNVVLQADKTKQAVTIPAQAVIRTGERAIVFIDLGGGRFAPREVKYGTENDGKMEILSGVDAGERVVTSAQFLLDSESKLREVVNKMSSPSDIQQETGPDAMDHAGMDHAGMDHASMDSGEMDYSKLKDPVVDNSKMDHTNMDHGAMDHGAMDRGTMDHSKMGH